MYKRSRILPPTIARDNGKGKGKAAARESSSSAVQTRLNIQAESSDSDNNSNKRPLFSSSEDETNFGGAKKRTRGGFVIRRRAPSSSSVSAAATHAAAAPTEFTTGGVTVKFPFTPYKSQQDMVSKIVEALQTGENALLESPTGSGKSLALLCGSLAWLESEKAKLSPLQHTRPGKAEATESSYFADEAGAPTSSSAQPPIPNCGSCSGLCGTADPSETKDASLHVRNTPATLPTSPHGSKEHGAKSEHDLGDRANFQSQQPKAQIAARSPVEIKYDDGPTPPVRPRDETLRDPTSTQPDSTVYTPRLPKIYFGTRTHKQITQLVKELKSNTVYRPKMAVLGSRNHYCINHRLANADNKNEGCQELLDNDRCYYKHHARELVTKLQLPKKSQNRIWDMEEIVQRGREMSANTVLDQLCWKACPYFASRSLAEQAELVFCPYNYLIDPHICKAMDIDLRNAIVILDEAHNIEDAACEAGGLELTMDVLNQAVDEFDFMVIHGKGHLAHSSQMLFDLSEMFLDILKDPGDLKNKGYEESSEVSKLLNHLSQQGLDSKTIHKYDQACRELSEALREKKEQKKSPETSPGPDESMMVSTIVMRAMEGIITILSRLLDPNLQCLDDYKCILVETLSRAENNDAAANERGKGSSAAAARSQKARKSTKGRAAADVRDSKKRMFKFWCLNPGIIFRPLSTQARSVILTSGTLSPMDSFTSELQTTFKIQLEADHVVDKGQVWTGVIPFGPKSIKMDGAFQSAGTYQYQDDLGRVVERIIQIIPHGVLCFVSSYNMLDKLLKRWQDTGMYDRLNTIKKVMQEPKRATTKTFDATLRRFYNHISGEVSKGSDGGAILFAVYRGKCSEGIDFTDTNCRAVLAVGIPYPAITDQRIMLKKEYNDLQLKQHREWTYTQQSQQHPMPAGYAYSQSLDHGNPTGSLAKKPQPRALLPGQRWYEIQAFRAYNQAIGRCIRHRNDWGAMILLDYRLDRPANQQSLSKWVRPLVKSFRDFETATHSMENWVLPLKSLPIQPSKAALPQEIVIATQGVDIQTLSMGSDLQGMVISESDIQANTESAPVIDSSNCQTANSLSRQEEVTGQGVVVIPDTGSGRQLEAQDQISIDDFEDLDVNMELGWDDSLSQSADSILPEDVNPDVTRGGIVVDSRSADDEDWSSSFEADITAELDREFDEGREALDTRNILAGLQLTPLEPQNNAGVNTGVSIGISSQLQDSTSGSRHSTITSAFREAPLPPNEQGGSVLQGSELSPSLPQRHNPVQPATYALNTLSRKALSFFSPSALWKPTANTSNSDPVGKVMSERSTPTTSTSGLLPTATLGTSMESTPNRSPASTTVPSEPMSSISTRNPVSTMVSGGSTATASTSGLVSSMISSTSIVVTSTQDTMSNIMSGESSSSNLSPSRLLTTVSGRSVLDPIPEATTNGSALDNPISPTKCRVFCKACSEPLLECMGRPTIKTVQKSMVGDLSQNKKLLIQSEGPQASTSTQPTLWSMLLPRSMTTSAVSTRPEAPNDGKLKRSQSSQHPSSSSSSGGGDEGSSGGISRNTTSSISTNGSAESSTRTSQPTILVVYESHVLEKYFGHRNNLDDVECILRPQDGLIYQRIMCSNCSRAKKAPVSRRRSSNSLRNAPAALSSPAAIPGLKGVMIVGRTREGPEIEEEKIGTIWFTPGEIRTG
ncbi:helicase C-terminal domain-containing protein [Mortierella sp. GBAus27b]|nr:helicase C-terminal domain-containing protein [Mortierella sp. GBAus27b]